MSNLVCVKTFADRLQADMARSLLEANVLDDNADKALAFLNEDEVENE
jgi:hypothetical protein